MEHSHTCRQVLHGRVVQTSAVVARTAFREEIRAHVATAVSPRTIENTAKHGYSGGVKKSTGVWNGALLSSVMYVGSLCVRLVDIHVYVVDLTSVIFRSAFSHDT